MKRLSLQGIKGEPYIFQMIEVYINKLLEELAEKGVIEIEEDDENGLSENDLGE